MSSGSTCAVVGCHNNSRKLKNALETFCLEHQQLRRACPCSPPYALHSMLRKEDRKLAWLAALRLKHPPKRVYVCSFHFIDKKPTELHPDPELYLGYDRPPPKKRRKLTRTTLSVTASSQASISTQPPEPHLHSVHTQWEDPSQQDHQYCDRSRRKDVQDKMTQCDEVAYFILQNDADALLYTGIALETFNTLVSTLEGYDNNEFTVPVRDQVLMTLMKLKSNRVIGDLSRQFHISQIMASKIISHWLDKLEEVLRPLIPWLPKETIQATMPEAFKKNFPNATCIIDCSETRNLGSRGESYSHYYSHNTVKYLVAVAPCGLIMFVSAAYGGRCSDKFITMDSGILTYLKPGDEVMADRGFTIKDLLFERKVRLVIPAFTKKRRQLTEEQVTYTRRIANVRIHVERAIRRLKVYKILSQIVPISMAPKVDKILRICAALVNLREDLIRDTQ
uniref:THAP-type domain-containing protein n=1 Tax=Oreochromis aureus TaxID=47969 RepID=A0AAZ1X4S5_OREAU